MDLSQNAYLYIFTDKWNKHIYSFIKFVVYQAIFCCFLYDYSFKCLNNHGRIFGHSYILLFLSHGLRPHYEFSSATPFVALLTQIWRAKTKVIPLESCALKSFPYIFLVHLFRGSLSKVGESPEHVKIWMHARVCWAALDRHPQKPAEGLVGGATEAH